MERKIKVKYRGRIFDLESVDFKHKEVWISRGTYQLAGIPIDQVVVVQGNMRMRVIEQLSKREKDPNSCARCGCLYDDKQKGAQGRNGACECNCGHISPDKKRYDFF